MPYKEKPLQKHYYTIGEVANRYGCYPSQIRYYLDQFDVKVNRTKNGDIRLFKSRDIATLDKIFYLVEVVKLTLKGARQWLRAGLAFPELPEHTLDHKARKLADKLNLNVTQSAAKSLKAHNSKLKAL